MEIPKNLNFSFNGKLISNTSSHKHLGVTLSHDAKWSEHLENIVKTIGKHLGVFKNLNLVRATQTKRKRREVFQRISDLFISLLFTFFYPFLLKHSQEKNNE